MKPDKLVIAGREFSSRLLVGTGKYASFAEMVEAHEKSGAEIVTVAVRRVNLSDRSRESLLDWIDTERYFILPNTAGCYSRDEAVRAARLGREAGLSNWVKLEVIGDEKTLFPDNPGRPAGLPGGQDSQEALRHRQQPAGGGSAVEGRGLVRVACAGGYHSL